MGRGCSVEDKHGLSIIVNDNVGALLASTDADIDWRHGDPSADGFDPVSTVLAILLCQLLLPNSFAIAFCFPVCGGLVHFFLDPL